MAIYKINESYGSEVHPEQDKIEKALLSIKGTTKVEFDYRPNDGVYKVPENHLIILPFCRDDKLFGDGFDYFKNRKEWKNKVIFTLRKLGWVQEDPMEDNDTYLYLVMKKKTVTESSTTTRYAVEYYTDDDESRNYEYIYADSVKDCKIKLKRHYPDAVITACIPEQVPTIYKKWDMSESNKNISADEEFVRATVQDMCSEGVLFDFVDNYAEFADFFKDSEVTPTKDLYQIFLDEKQKCADEIKQVRLQKGLDKSKSLDERWADDALDELSKKPKSEWTDDDWDTYNYCKNANAERDYYDSLEETINSSEPAWDEIKAMRDEENDRAKRQERFKLMHKVFDKYGLRDSDDKWTSDLYELFGEAEEIKVVTNLNVIPNRTEDGQAIKYRWSVEDINIYTDAYADYVYILEPAQLTEGFRYTGTDKTSEKLTMDALNELAANPGEVYNYKKFDIFYGENKDHFPFNPCYYIKFRPSGYTSMMFSKDHCLKYINDNKLDESLTETVSYGTYDNTALEADLLALDGVIQVDWDLKSYDELGQVIVLTKYNISNKADLTDWFIQRSDILKSILSVFKKHNLKLEDPVEDQGTWWYFVLRPNNQVASDRPTFEYMMVEFFETSGSPADDIMRRTKDIKYQDPSKLSEILVNADKIFRETDDLGGYNKVYFDNYIRYQGKLYKFHAGRVDLGDGEKAVSLPTDYIKLVEDYFLDEIKAGNNKIPIVEE